MYLVSGVYIQDRESLALKAVPIEGMTVVVRRQLAQVMYYGMLWPDASALLGQYAGEFIDASGRSRITDALVLPGRFEFTKQYLHQQWQIHYSLRPFPDGDWVGTYESPEVGSGITRCKLTALEDSFFDLDVLAKELGHPLYEPPITEPLGRRKGRGHRE